MKIFVAVLEGDSVDIAAAKSQKGLDKVLASYCRKNWSELDFEIEIPTEDEEVIDVYFRYSDEDYEIISIDTDDLVE